VCFSLWCKMVCPSIILSVRSAGVVPCASACPCTFTHTHTHIADRAISVGPVGGVAIARLVNLALLLQAAGLAPLAGTNLNNNGQQNSVGRLGSKFKRGKGLTAFGSELPVHPELDGDAAAVSVVAGEAGCGGMGQVHSLQELLLGSGALDPPVLMAG